MGGSFAVWGGLFASFDCTLMYLRQREDHWNAIAAGALTGGVLSARMGANAAFRSAVMGGVILVRFGSSVYYSVAFFCKACMFRKGDCDIEALNVSQYSPERGKALLFPFNHD